MIDFAEYKRITIPEGSVKQIARASDGLVLWKAGYINQVPLSIDTDVEVFNGGLGYQNNQELSGSSGAQRSNTNTTVTGFIPVKQGDTIRIKGCNWYSTAQSNYIVAYTSSFEHWSTTQTQGTHYYNTTNNPKKFAIERSSNGGSMDISSDVSTIVIATNYGADDGYDKIAYIRISVRGNGVDAVEGAELIVTVNEEIV